MFSFVKKMFPANFSTLTRPPTELKLAHNIGTMPNCEYLAGELHRGHYDDYTEKEVPPTTKWAAWHSAVLINCT